MQPHSRGWLDVHDPDFRYPTNPEHYLPENVGSAAQWMWHIGDLKTSARSCRCCNFILETLNASPWMTHEDKDFIVLRSGLVGSKMSGVLATPQERDGYDLLLNYGNRPSMPYSEYDRYHRPMLELFKKEERGEGGRVWLPCGS